MMEEREGEEGGKEKGREGGGKMRGNLALTVISKSRRLCPVLTRDKRPAEIKSAFVVGAVSLEDNEH